MKRREFLLKSAQSAAVLAGAGLYDYAEPLSAEAANTGGGLGIAEALEILERGKGGNFRPEIRPEIRDNPRAVFIIETRVDARKDADGFFTEARPQLEEAGKLAARSIFVKGSRRGGSTVIIPNFTTVSDRLANPAIGIITSPDFIAGFIGTLRDIGNTNAMVSERGGSMKSRQITGIYDIFDSRNIRLIEASYRRVSDYSRGEINWSNVPGNPMVMKKIPTTRPVGDKDCFYINMPKLKSHNLGLTTLSIKNIQGAVPVGYGHFCNRWPTVEFLARLSYGTDFDGVFVKDYYQNVEREFLRHRKMGFKHWDYENAYPEYEKKGGWEAFRKIKHDSRLIKEFTSGIENVMYDETWCQRAIDAVSAVKPGVNIIEGVIGRDGSGFDHGTDYLVNYIVIGLSRLETDSVASILMGQNPLELYYTRIGKERGLGENNPEKIQINWIRENGSIEPVKNLAELRRTPLGVNLHAFRDKELLFW